MMHSPTHAMRGGFAVREIKSGIGADNILEIVNKINWFDDMSWSPFQDQPPLVLKESLKIRKEINKCAPKKKS